MASIKAIQHDVITALPVRDIASCFRDGLQTPTGGFRALIAAKGLHWAFRTPERSNDPFAALDGASAPTFSAEGLYSLRGGGADRGAVLLQIWDENGLRRASVLHSGDLSPASKAAVASVIDRLRAGDPNLRLSESKGRVGLV